MYTLRTAVEQTIIDLAYKKTPLDYITTSEVMIRLPHQGPQKVTRATVMQEMQLVARIHRWTVWAGISGPVIVVGSIFP